MLSQINICFLKCYVDFLMKDEPKPKADACDDGWVLDSI